MQENALKLFWLAAVSASPGSGGLLHDLVDCLGKLLRVHARTLSSSSPMLRILPKVLGNSMSLEGQVPRNLAWNSGAIFVFAASLRIFERRQAGHPFRCVLKRCSNSDLLKSEPRLRDAHAEP